MNGVKQARGQTNGGIQDVVTAQANTVFCSDQAKSHAGLKSRGTDLICFQA